MNRRDFFQAGTAATLSATAGMSTVAAAPLAGGVDAIGLPIADLPTPALLLDLDAFEANLKIMADHCRKAGCGFRPHAKTHKCPAIARAQVASGALGVSVATVPEAEGMVGAGVRGVLLTSPIVEKTKAARMAEL